MSSLKIVCCFVVIFVTVISAQDWSGYVCSTWSTCYRQRRQCNRWAWYGETYWCTSSKMVSQSYSCKKTSCCQGWTHSGDGRCIIPVPMETSDITTTDSNSINDWTSPKSDVGKSDVTPVYDTTTTTTSAPTSPSTTTSSSSPKGDDNERNICPQPSTCYRQVCRQWFLIWCWSWRTESYACTSYFCCPGWKTEDGRSCDIPICSPPCQNGGRCVAPGQCQCWGINSGPRCEQSLSFNAQNASPKPTKAPGNTITPNILEVSPPTQPPDTLGNQSTPATTTPLATTTTGVETTPPGPTRMTSTTFVSESSTASDITPTISAGTTNPSAVTGNTPASTAASTPGSTPESTPGNTPGGTPSNTPANTPGSTPGNTPGNTTPITPADTPGSTPSNTPSNTPGNTPTGSTAITPGNTTPNTPAGSTLGTTPGNTPGNTPTGSTANTPGNTTPNTPGSTPGNTPGNTPIGSTANTAGNTPGSTPGSPPPSTSAPGSTSANTATNTPASTPGNTPGTPGNTPGNTQASTASMTPGNTNGGLGTATTGLPTQSVTVPLVSLSPASQNP